MSRCRGEDRSGVAGGVRPPRSRFPFAGPDSVGRQAGATGQAAASPQGWWPQSAHLLPDGALLGHSGGLPHQQKVRGLMCIFVTLTITCSDYTEFYYDNTASVHKAYVNYLCQIPV